MSGKTANFVMFVFGAGVGTVVTWLYVKKKYELIAQQEINSVKDVFSKKETDFVPRDSSGIREKTENAREYAAQVQQHGYTNYSDVHTNTINNEEQKEIENRPYVITPEEFGEIDDYEKISLTYYADRVLADDDDEVVDDVEDVVGSDSLTSFGEYEDDSVFVRNHRLRCDYEILADQRRYSDVIDFSHQEDEPFKKKKKPHRVEE